MVQGGTTGARYAQLAGAAAAAAALAFGAAHWAFYSRLGVQPGEVGIGVDDIMMRAGVGVVAVASLMLTAGWLAVTVNLVLFATVPIDSKTPPPRGRVEWVLFAVIVLMVAPVAFAAWRLLLRAPEALVVFAVAVGAAAFGWKTRRPTSDGQVAPWEVALLIALGWIASMVVVFVGWAVAAGTRSISVPAVVWTTFVVQTAIAVVFAFRYAAHERTIERQTWSSVVRVGVVVLAVVVAAMTVPTTSDNARVVQQGGVLDGDLDLLVAGPVTCTAVRWLSEIASPLPARHLLHLGGADGRVVLYRPGHGAVRVPAEHVALLPASPARCRPEKQAATGATATGGS